MYSERVVGKNRVLTGETNKVTPSIDLEMILFVKESLTVTEIKVLQIQYLMGLYGNSANLY